MLRLSAGTAFALAATLSVTGCSNPVGPASLNPDGPAFSQNSSGSNSGKQKCQATDAAAMGARNMIKGKHMFDIAMIRAADQGNEGMFHALEVSGCW